MSHCDDNRVQQRLEDNSMTPWSYQATRAMEYHEAFLTTTSEGYEKGVDHLVDQSAHNTQQCTWSAAFGLVSKAF